MKKFIRYLDPSGAYCDGFRRRFTDIEQPDMFPVPYPDWNASGKDMAEYETLEAALTGFRLMAYEPLPYRIEKDTLFDRLDALGKWDAFETWMKTYAPKQWSALVIKPYIMSNNPMFVEHAPIVKDALSLTDEQFAELIKPG